VVGDEDLGLEVVLVVIRLDGDPGRLDPDAGEMVEAWLDVSG
jgi:hypothetical protein